MGTKNLPPKSRGLEVVLGRLLKPIGLAHNHPPARLDHAGQCIERARVSPKDPTGAHARCQTEACGLSGLNRRRPFG